MIFWVLISEHGYLLVELDFFSPPLHALISERVFLWRGGRPFRLERQRDKTSSQRPLWWPLVVFPPARAGSKMPFSFFVQADPLFFGHDPEKRWSRFFSLSPFSTQEKSFFRLAELFLPPSFFGVPPWKGRHSFSGEPHFFLLIFLMVGKTSLRAKQDPFFFPRILEAKILLRALARI